MRRQPFTGTRIAAVFIKRIGVIVFVFMALLIIVSIQGYISNWQWTGLPDPDPSNPQSKAKTLWDWLNLLIIPLVLTGGAWWLRKAETDIARETERERAEETTLASFFENFMSTDFFNRLNKHEESPSERFLARVRIQNVLRQLNVERRNRALQFLRDTDLLGVSTIKAQQLNAAHHSSDVALLLKANLADIDLRGTDFHNVNLRGVDLGNADLRGAILSGADLSHANLDSADLRGAILQEADLSYANLAGTNLERTNLSGSNLSHVNLCNANLTWADVESCVLSGAEMNNAVMRFTSFFRSDLTDVTYIGSDATGAHFIEANMVGSHCRSTKLRGAVFNDADLHDAGFFNAKGLRCSQLRRAKNWESARRDKSLACGKP